MCGADQLTVKWKLSAQAMLTRNPRRSRDELGLVTTRDRMTGERRRQRLRDEEGMKPVVLFIGIMLALLVGLRPATAISDRTRSTWQEACQERQVAVLDKCNLSRSDLTAAIWDGTPGL